jgi:hypothetical protein
MAASELTNRKSKSKGLKNQKVENTLFSHSLLERQIVLPMLNVGKNLMQTFDSYVKMNYEGKCSVEGFIKPGSINIISYSAGQNIAENIIFTVVFECQICCPVEGMKIPCIAKNITKAGIRAESKEDPSPIVVFIARDHYYEKDYFNNVKEGDNIMIKVIGQRFELNDKYISIVAELSNKGYK